MAAILHDLNELEDPRVLEEGVLWELGGAPWHRMLVSGAEGRYLVVDELDSSGYCCSHCSPDIDTRPAALVNEVASERAWLRAGDVLGIGDRRWRVEIRRGAVSPLRDLFRIAPPQPPARFGALLSSYEASLDPAAAGGLLRFAHVTANHGALARTMQHGLAKYDAAKAETRAATAALAIGLTRLNALPRPAAKKMLEQCAEDSQLDRWLHISALAQLALDDNATWRASDLRLQVLAALEEGDAPAAVEQACETLALVLEDEPLRALGEAARAVVSDATARKRRTMAVTVLVALAERDPECARAVLRAASDPHEHVRAAAARALAALPSMHEASANAALLGLLGDGHDEVFEEAFAALFGGPNPRLPADSLLAEVDRAGRDATRLARLTQALDRLT